MSSKNNFDIDFIPLPDSPPPASILVIPPPEEIPPPPPEEIPPPPSSPPRREHSSRRKEKKSQLKHDINDIAIADTDQDLMARMLGFSSFNSTKGKKVPGNEVGAVRVLKKRRYRQYMNRKGGFNRPLDNVP